MNDRFTISLLLDYYGPLLTDKQNDIMDLYINNDLSLKEISEITKTSRQAIYDIIKRCDKQLGIYEEKLAYMEKDQKRDSDIKVLISKIDTIKESVKDDDIYNSLKELNEYIVRTF
ncbi:putative DNA-binding protein [Clostridium grantii]|uniref:UPF0122 protein SAMN02745207_00313 n=1 Tax=Clostridium grantii DSM 8605 TaxID=1121316 RepID=A0A1M5QV24_9CLOT|nr:putative DNA-binding protein [Clostridium grantii]SHH17952.1 hypothetical protein SAMN02745207_00313 [Clostridium grantii DSM 8605]